MTGPAAPGGSRTRTRIFFYAVPPPEARDVEGNRLEALRFPTLREARKFADGQGNGWRIEQAREPINSMPAAPEELPDEES